jgi:hypothetical protein
VGKSIHLKTGHESDAVTSLSWRSARIVEDNAKCGTDSFTFTLMNPARQQESNQALQIQNAPELTVCPEQFSLTQGPLDLY